MEQKIVKKIPEDAKLIKVVGQGCTDDCETWHEVSGQNYPIAGGMVPACYERICSGYYTYDAFWTSAF